MSRNYNLLSVAFNTDYGNTQAEFEEFLDLLSDELGWYDTKETIKVLTWDWCNNTPEVVYDNLNNQMYVLTDWTQKIDPEELLEAFNYWANGIPTLDCWDDYEGDVDYAVHEKQREFLKLVAKKIWESDIF